MLTLGAITSLGEWTSMNVWTADSHVRRQEPVNGTPNRTYMKEDKDHIQHKGGKRHIRQKSHVSTTPPLLPRQYLWPREDILVLVAIQMLQNPLIRHITVAYSTGSLSCFEVRYSTSSSFQNQA